MEWLRTLLFLLYSFSPSKQCTIVVVRTGNYKPVVWKLAGNSDVSQYICIRVLVFHSWALCRYASPNVWWISFFFTLTLNETCEVRSFEISLAYFLTSFFEVSLRKKTAARMNVLYLAGSCSLLPQCFDKMNIFQCWKLPSSEWMKTFWFVSSEKHVFFCTRNSHKLQSSNSTRRLSRRVPREAEALSSFHLPPDWWWLWEHTQYVFCMWLNVVVAHTHY